MNVECDRDDERPAAAENPVQAPPRESGHEFLFPVPCPLSPVPCLPAHLLPYNLAMPSQNKPFNPFYAGLVVVGTAFAITACAYGVMTVRMLNPQAADDQGLIQFLDDYGLAILIGELALLAVLTFAAIGTDDYWTRRAAANQAPEGRAETKRDLP